VGRRGSAASRERGVIKLEEGAALIGTRGETGGAARGDRSIRKARSK